MGRQALLAVICWLTLSLAFGDKITHSFAVIDNESAESAPRLYRNVPVGVYASAAPYGAYSFHLPTFAAAPKPAASQLVPARENFVNHLTDSYGNKFVGTPQLTTYKIAFPQQFVPLQTKLPEHLAQPLVAASANFQFKQSNGQFFGVPYRVPALQGPVPTPLHQFQTFGKLYGDNVKNLAPNSVIHSQSFGIPNTHQQSTNNKAVFTNNHSHEQLTSHRNEPKLRQQKEPQLIIGKPKVNVVQPIHHETHSETKFQRIQEAPHLSHSEPKFQRIQEASQSSHSEPKFQNTQEPPHQSHGELKFQKIHDVTHTHNDDVKTQKHHEGPHSHHSEPKLSSQSHSSHDEGKYQRVQDLPHYESKFQIIEEHHNAPKLQNQEHNSPHGGVKFQRVQEASPTAQTQHSYEQPQEKPQYTRQQENTQYSQNKKSKLQAAPAKQTITYINDVNGKKTIVELETKPNLPLLDLTLLEPLTFDNPLVPQVQHYLPRISQATYQKLPELNLPTVKNYQKDYVVQKTTSYDSADGLEKPYKEVSKKKHKKPIQPNKYAKKTDSPKKTTVTYHESLDDAPEVIYEINSPTYKETIKEKAVSYNKETQSAPEHYTYGSTSDKDPVTYSYSRTSKEPVQIMSVQYHGKGPHLIYTFKPEEHSHEEKPHNSAPHHSDAKNDRESSHETDDEDHEGHTYHENTEQYNEQPKSTKDHHERQHNEKKNYHEVKSQGVAHDSPVKYYSEPAQFRSENINFQPILREYENNIQLLSVPSASIKVDPHNSENQLKSTPEPDNIHHEGYTPPPQHHQAHGPAPQEYPRSTVEPQRHHQQSKPQLETYNTPSSKILEKSKRIIIQEETPDEMHMLSEQMRAQVTTKEENSEEDFEKAYHDAAIGFPAYKQKFSDSEKEIFDPESYGVPRHHVEYDFKDTPFQQYQEEGDDFPKETRSRYKDARDKMIQNYYSDFSVSKPEGLLDRYQNKLGYYKLYKEQKPDYLVDNDDEKNKKSAKFVVAPSFDFHSSQDKGKSYYGHAEPKQQLYEYDYSKGTPRDSSAFASRPYQSYKSRTSFVEPQFQYGFEPISIPKLLDSELAAMASNDSPESEKPGTRKKIYKENWYIKKTSTSAGAPAS